MKKGYLLSLLLMIAFYVHAQDTFFDSTFGNGGRQTFSITGSTVLNAVSIDSSGNVYAAGTVRENGNTRVLLTKNLGNGLPATDFGNQGVIKANFNSANKDEFHAIAVSPAQKIVAGGFMTIGAVKNALLIRYKSNGELDSSFGINGVVTSLTGNYTQINALVVEENNKIVAAGVTGGSKAGIWVARYNDDGSLDVTFGNNGVTTVHFNSSSSDSLTTVALQQNGKIVLGGMVSYPPNLGGMMLLRLTANGQLDSTFGNNGFTIYNNDFFGGELIEIAVLADGSIVANDYRSGSISSVRPFIKKFSSDGHIDYSFNNADITGYPVACGVVLSFSTSSSTGSIVNALAATSDGGFIGAGAVLVNSGAYPAVAKLKANGHLDSTFGNNGLITGYLPNLNFPYTSREIKDIAIQKDQKVVAGVNIGTPFSSFELDRFTNIPLYLGADILLCPGTNSTLNAQNSGSSYLWSTGETTQTINVRDSGIYFVTVTSVKGRATDTIHISYNPPPIVELGNDTAICAGNTLTLDAKNTGATYRWNTGANSQSIIIDTSGVYHVEVTNIFECTETDSIKITINPSTVTVDIGLDTSICEGSLLELDAKNAGSVFLWNDGSTSSKLTVSQSGVYSVTVTAPDQCRGFDEVNVTVHNLPSAALGSDTTFCAGSVLDAQNGGASYIWSTGATTQTIVVNTSGYYSVTVTDEELCSNSDTVSVIVKPLPLVDLGNDTFVANGTVITLDAGNPGASYVWSDGGNTQTRNVINSGMYSVIVTDENDCSASDSVTITFGPVGLNASVTSKKNISVSPNPTDGIIIIHQQSPSHQATRFALIDIQGRIVKSIFQKQQKQSYSLDDLPAGIYFLRVDSGEEFRIIKQ